MTTYSSVCSELRKWLAVVCLALVGATVMPAGAGVTVVLQTFNGAAGTDFVASNGAALNTGSLFMLFCSTNGAGTIGFDPTNTTSPRDGDILVDYGPLADGTVPSIDGQVCGYLLEPYELPATGSLYLAVFDCSYADFINANTSVPAQTCYCLTTNAMVPVRQSDDAGYLTDLGGTINDAVRTQGAYATDQIIEGVPPPAWVTATNQVTGIELNWQASAAATSYRIYRSTALGLDDPQLLGTSTGTNYLDAMTNSTRAYYYWVSGVVGEQEGSLSVISNRIRQNLPGLPWLLPLMN